MRLVQIPYLEVGWSEPTFCARIFLRKKLTQSDLLFFVFTPLREVELNRSGGFLTHLRSKFGAVCKFDFCFFLNKVRDGRERHPAVIAGHVTRPSVEQTPHLNIGGGINLEFRE